MAAKALLRIALTLLQWAASEYALKGRASPIVLGCLRIGHQEWAVVLDLKTPCPPN